MLGADCQQQLPRHDIVAVLVDATNHLGQRRRFPGQHTARRFGYRALAEPALQRAAELTPERAKYPVDIGVMLEHRAAQAVVVTAGREVALEDDARHVGRVVDIETDPRLITAAGPVHEIDAIPNREVRQLRVGRDQDPPLTRIGQKKEPDRLEIDEQGVRHDIVGSIRLAIESAGVLGRDIEEAVVQQQIALDFMQAETAHAAEQLPELLDDEKRIAMPLDREIAVEPPAVETTIEIDLGRPGVSRPEQPETRPCGDELHDGRRVSRHLGQVAQHRLGRIETPDENAYVGGINAQPGQGALDRFG